MKYRISMSTLQHVMRTRIYSIMKRTRYFWRTGCYCSLKDRLMQHTAFESQRSGFHSARRSLTLKVVEANRRLSSGTGLLHWIQGEGDIHFKVGIDINASSPTVTYILHQCCIDGAKVPESSRCMMHILFFFLQHTSPLFVLFKCQFACKIVQVLLLYILQVAPVAMISTNCIQTSHSVIVPVYEIHHSVLWSLLKLTIMRDMMHSLRGISYFTHICTFSGFDLPFETKIYTFRSYDACF